MKLEIGRGGRLRTTAYLVSQNPPSPPQNLIPVRIYHSSDLSTIKMDLFSSFPQQFKGVDQTIVSFQRAKLLRKYISNDNS